MRSSTSLHDRRGQIAIGLIVLLVLVGSLTLVWMARVPLSRLAPIHHEGVVMRISDFHKGGFSGKEEGTHQLRQFAIIFEDGFDCEGSDSSFAAIREGDRIEIKAYHDVRGMPLLDPEWWECDEAQFERLIAPVEQAR